MKTLGRWLLVLAVLAGLVIIGGFAIKFLLGIGLLLIKLLLGLFVVGLLWIGWLILKAAWKRSTNKS